MCILQTMRMPGKKVEDQVEYPMQASMESKSDYVRRVFENVPHYLKGRQVDILLRIEAARTAASSLSPRQVLDIGCGNGAVSLQLLNEDTDITLMDLSASMLKTAAASVPQRFSKNVETRNEDFMSAQFGKQTFDLIIAVGVMAHVDSPEAFIRKIHRLLAPGGRVVLEFTDAFHFVGRTGRFWSWCKELLAPATYQTNKISIADVKPMLDRQQLAVVSTYRYSRVPLPGFTRIVGAALEHRLVKAMFGDCAKNRNAWMGNEYLFLLGSAALDARLENSMETAAQHA